MEISSESGNLVWLCDFFLNVVAMALSEEHLRPNNCWKRLVRDSWPSLTEQQRSVIDSCTQTGNLIVLNKFLCQEEFNSHGTGPNRIWRRLLEAAPFMFRK